MAAERGGFARTALRIAWRDLRGSPGKFVFVVLAVAAGVGALTGVRGFSESFRHMLADKARAILAADLSMIEFTLPDAAQQTELRALEARGVRMTRVTSTLTMAAPARGAIPSMVAIKAVDPDEYPFYGEVKLRPDAPLRTAVTDSTVAVNEAVLTRMSLAIGDNLLIGGQPFRIAAAVLTEPDRLSGGGMNIGLRVMMTQRALDRVGLIAPGSRAPQRTLFKLPPTVRVDQVRRELQRSFPEAQISDYRQSNPAITRGLERATTFVSLVSLVALIVGALGVAMAMNAHLQQHLDGIAIMKSLGARSRQVIGIYLIETLLLGLAGALIGVAAGYGIQQAGPPLIERWFNVQVQIVWSWAALAQGIAIGLLTTTLFTLPPLLRIRRIRPSLILRRDMGQDEKPWLRRWLEARAALLAAVLIVAGVGGIAAWLGDSAKTGALFAAGLSGSLLALGAVAWLLLRGLRVLLRHGPALPVALRHGLANLYRPGNQAASVLVALGVGVMFTLTIWVVQHSLVHDIIETAPPGVPNVFLIDIQPHEKDALLKMVRSQPGIQGGIDIVPAIQMRLTAVNGRPVEKLGLEHWGRRFLRTRSVTVADARPAHVQVLGGSWWRAGETAPLVAVEEDAARTLHIGPGSSLAFVSQDQTVTAHVATVYRADSFRMGGMSEFTFTPRTLAGLPAIWFAGVHVRPDRVPDLQRVVYDRYPTITVIDMADALALLQTVIDQIAKVIRFLSGFSILAGIIVLAASVAGTRMRRVREVAILKALGGTRGRIVAIFSIEFLVLGCVAGLIGGLLANGFANILLHRLLDAAGEWHAGPVLIAVFATAMIATATGWLASFRILRQRPLEVLRDE
ncbi:MAG TPA: FtsX-like permease family protein [Bryobacteraceae bacterium]|nr:FtsX-like permease family protein [Bryobacteraceae bacterium]